MTCTDGIHENWPLAKLSTLEVEHSGCLFTHSTIGLDRPLRVAMSDVNRSIDSSNQFQRCTFDGAGYTNSAVIVVPDA
jgi:hypothetical protein